MIDIVERLRHPARYDIDLNEAADEIERLRKEAERLRKLTEELQEA
jgi:hypothetical protein